jgi:hypothetical protein
MMKISGVGALFLILTLVVVIFVLVSSGAKAIHIPVEGKVPSTSADRVLLNTCLITNDPRN